MKKITLLFFFITANLVVAQTTTTGDVMLSSATHTVKFDVDTGTGLVTMTLKGPSGTWLGIGPGISLGNGMGNLNDDAIVYHFPSNTIQDRNMRSGTGEPPLDNTTLNGTGAATTLDWTTVSSAINGSIRTVIGTRAINTNDVKDFVFPTTEVSVPLVWSIGPAGGAFTYHTGGRSGTMMTFTSTLSTEDFDAPTKFSIYPNPGNEIMNINVPTLTDAGLELEVYDVLGKKVYSELLSSLTSKVNIAKWNSGLYIVRLSSPTDDITLTKRFVKL